MKATLEVAIETTDRKSVQQALSNLKRQLSEARPDGTLQTLVLRDANSEWVGLAKFQEEA